MTTVAERQDTVVDLGEQTRVTDEQITGVWPRRIMSVTNPAWLEDGITQLQTAYGYEDWQLVETLGIIRDESTVTCLTQEHGAPYYSTRTVAIELDSPIIVRNGDGSHYRVSSASMSYWHNGSAVRPELDQTGDNGHLMVRGANNKKQIDFQDDATPLEALGFKPEEVRRAVEPKEGEKVVTIDELAYAVSEVLYLHVVIGHREQEALVQQEALSTPVK